MGLLSIVRSITNIEMGSIWAALSTLKLLAI
jgi:hypothetical protein